MHYSVQIVQFKSLSCTHYIVQYCVLGRLSNVYSLQFTVTSVQRLVQSLQLTVFSLQCTVYSEQFTGHSV